MQNYLNPKQQRAHELVGFQFDHNTCVRRTDTALGCNALLNINGMYYEVKATSDNIVCLVLAQRRDPKYRTRSKRYGETDTQRELRETKEAMQLREDLRTKHTAQIKSHVKACVDVTTNFNVKPAYKQNTAIQDGSYNRPINPGPKWGVATPECKTGDGIRYAKNGARI